MQTLPSSILADTLPAVPSTSPFLSNSFAVSKTACLAFSTNLVSM